MKKNAKLVLAALSAFQMVGPVAQAVVLDGNQILSQNISGSSTVTVRCDEREFKTEFTGFVPHMGNYVVDAAMSAEETVDTLNHIDSDYPGVSYYDAYPEKLPAFFNKGACTIDTQYNESAFEGENDYDDIDDVEYYIGN